MVMMPPKEKAIELVMSFMKIKDTNDMGWAGMNNHMAKQCALIAVDEILSALDSFGYTGCMYDDFETGHVLYTDDKDPSEYWQEVKQEIEKNN